MCLAVPVQLVEIQDGNTGVFKIGEEKNTVNLSLLDGAVVGDYILIHAGFAIEKLNETEAAETLALLGEISEAGNEGEA